MKLSSQKMKPLALALLATLAVCSCGAERSPFETSAADDSSLHYIPFGSVRSCGLANARAPSLKVCVNPAGLGEDVVSKAKDYTSRSLLTWLKALRQIDPKVTSKIEFTCSGAHMNVTMRPGAGTSFASCSNLTVYAERPYGTYLHELGHAFAALGDTYAGSAGSCKPGQPKSVMCWGAYGPNKDPQGFNMLFEDDVTGLHANYKQLFSDTTTPDASINPLGPLDVNNPWPGSGSINSTPSPSPSTNPGTQIPQQPSIFVGMGEPSATNPLEVGIFISTPATMASVLACTDTVNPASCAQDASKSIQGQFVRQEGGRNIFALSRTIAPVEFTSKSIIIFGFATQSATGAAAAERRIRFVQK